MAGDPSRPAWPDSWLYSFMVVGGPVVVHFVDAQVMEAVAEGAHRDGHPRPGGEEA